MKLAEFELLWKNLYSRYPDGTYFAPFDGTVLGVLLEEGTDVVKGQALCVLQPKKIKGFDIGEPQLTVTSHNKAHLLLIEDEIDFKTVTAKGDRRVVEVHIQKGMEVKKDQPLFILESKEKEEVVVPVSDLTSGEQTVEQILNEWVESHQDCSLSEDVTRSIAEPAQPSPIPRKISYPDLNHQQQKKLAGFELLWKNLYSRYPDGTIFAPYDGTVLDVLLEEGTEVDEGQVLCVLEAKKIKAVCNEDHLNVNKKRKASSDVGMDNAAKKKTKIIDMGEPQLTITPHNEAHPLLVKEGMEIKTVTAKGDRRVVKVHIKKEMEVKEFQPLFILESKEKEVVSPINDLTSGELTVEQIMNEWVESYQDCPLSEDTTRMTAESGRSICV